MDITEVTILHHVGIVFLLIWGLSSFNYCHPLVYIFTFIYLFVVHERYAMRLRRKVQFEERRQANQRKVLSDSESVRWLNHAVEKMWPVCMEQIVSQKILLPIIPWFLQKYKPWTARDATVQSLYLGRSPPMFTEMRVLRDCPDDDHLVLELGMNFRTAEDMSAILAVKLRKRLGFGMWAKLHLLGMHVEGKVLVGVKFIHRWPFIGRLRVCFVEPPYFQMTIKPVIAHGLDVTELPGIAGWMDKLLGIAFEETLVEPNMLVVDVEKFASPEPENWFSVDAKDPVAYAIVEVIEASDMKPADMNGLADPYVKGQLGVYRFRTKTRKKTLTPKWLEEFKIPICSWESSNVLNIEVRDKDHFYDDTLGDCSININDLQDGQRHDMWLNLQNIKMGRLHIALRVLEKDGKVAEQTFDGDTVDNEYKRNSFASDSANKESFSSEPSETSPKMTDTFEPIDVEGQRETGIWVHHPGPEVAQKWEPRKGKNRVLDSKIQEGAGDSAQAHSNRSSVSGLHQNDSSSTDECLEDNKTNSKNALKRGLHKIGSVFHRSHKNEHDNFEEPIPSPHPNLKAINTKKIGVNFVMEENLSPYVKLADDKSPKVDGVGQGEDNGPESPNKKNVKGVAKSILKHAGKSARGLRQALSRKESNRSRDDSREVSVESSDVESLPSPVRKPELESDSTVSNPSSVPGSDTSTEPGNTIESNKFYVTDVPEQPITITATTEEKVGVDSPGSIIVPDSSFSVQGNHQELVTSSSPKYS